MTKPTSSRSLAVVLSALALGACGSNPYVGDSTSTDTGTQTGTPTSTTTKSSTDTKSTTTSVTNSNTSTGSTTQTSTPSGTGTNTSSATTPVTITVTTTMTVTSTAGGAPDAGIDSADVGPDVDPNASTDPNVPDIYINVAPIRLLDLVVMIDNSPSMAPKISKMNAQFPKLIAALKDPNDKTLPDLRVAIIDSDLGTNGAYGPGGSCSEKTMPDGTVSKFGDLGRFQMIGATGCGVNSADSLYLEYKAGQPVNFTGDINTVFACLAGGVGTMGCGEEHQLQAFEFALAVKNIGNDNQQQALLRGNAQLGLIFLTDEDDCSAAPNDGLFGDKPELRGESASLRCASRAHACGGKNLTDTPPGYPTTASFTHAFNDCRARIGDECSGTTDTSVPTDCNPLKNVTTLAAEMKALKSNPDQVFVAGIFGWPLTEADMGSAQYKIAPIPNPNSMDTAHPTVYDYWPVCYDPTHAPSASTTDGGTGFDWTAAGWGATGGLRESAFIDEFGANGMKFSICQPDFSASMKKIGDTLANKLQSQCIDYKLADADSKASGLQPDCHVAWRFPKVDPADPTKIIWEDSGPALPECPAGSTNGNVTTDCWQLINDTTNCPLNGQMVNILRTAQEIRDTPQLAPGTQVHMQCRVCTATSPASGC